MKRTRTVCFPGFMNSIFFLRESDYLLHFVIDAALNSDGVINEYLTWERQVYREGLCLKKRFHGFFKDWHKMP